LIVDVGKFLFTDLRKSKMKNELSPFNMIIFSVAVGVLVANIYYAQPLFVQMAHDFNIQPSLSGFLVTLSQLGYAAGVLLIVPLGDKIDRRKILSFMLCSCTISLVGAAVSPTFSTLAIASLISGVTSSATMVIIPYVASHTNEQTRGKYVGQVMTGLLLGILLARTIAGVITELLNWRWIYVISSIAVAILTILLHKIMIKDNYYEQEINYKKLIFSILKLFMNESEIRWRCLFSFLGLAGFSILWTGITFLLSEPTYGYNTATIGLLGLLGIAGALSANISGRLGDSGHAQNLTVLFPFLFIICWICMLYGSNNIIFICIGIFIGDLSVQGLQVTHQSVLYKLNGNIRSRITSLFVTSGFVGMSLGSTLASTSYTYIGWDGLCLVGGCIALILFICCVVKVKITRNDLTKVTI